MGTATPYGYNYHIDSIGNLTSPECQSVKVLNLFDRTTRRPRRHESRRYNKSEITDVSFYGLCRSVFIIFVLDCIGRLCRIGLGFLKFSLI